MIWSNDDLLTFELGPDKESTMGGAMYVEVMVPKQIRSPYPVVFIHGAAQTGVDWLMTPDGRPGWASNFLDMGYVVYLQDVPARGRSQYVPGVDGGLTMMTAATLEERFTARGLGSDDPRRVVQLGLVTTLRLAVRNDTTQVDVHDER